MSKDIVQSSIECLANMPIEDTTYQVARNVVLDEIYRLNNIINELERWLKEHSIIDYNCSDVILHEQMALNIAFEYLQFLKENKQ